MDVTLADQLIGKISAADNNYSYGSPVVTWAGLNGATNYSNSSDCSNFETLLIEQAYGFTPSQISGWTGYALPQAIDYYNAAVDDKGFTGFTQIADLQVGDAVFFNYTNDPDANGDTGHVATVEALPTVDTAYSTPSQIAYDITVDDCSADPHSDDTRNNGDTGVGRGEMRFYTNLAGNITAYSWGLSSSSVVEPMSLRSFIFAKMPPAAGNTFLAAGSQATWNSSNDTLAITGPSAIIADPGLSQQPVVTDSGNQLLIMPGNKSTIHLASLNLSNDAMAQVFDPNGGKLLLDVAGNIGNGVVAIDPTSRLDLQSNDMIVHGGNLANITRLVASGYNAARGGDWKGFGITSSSAAGDTTHLTALGAIQNSTGTRTLYTNFDGVSAASADVLVRCTYFGDTNLDGKVDGLDYSRMDAGSLGGNSLTGWGYGDLNYDGTVNGSDYTLIDNTFNSQGSQMVFGASQIADPKAEIAYPAAFPGAASVPTDSDSTELKKMSKRRVVVEMLGSQL